MRRTRTLLAALAAAVTAATTLASPPASVALVPTVHIQGSAYSPDVIVVSPNAPITWINEDSMRHSATSDDKLFDTGRINGGDSKVITFKSAGRFPYHCKFHSFMHGKVVVGVLADGSALEGWKLRWASERAPEGVAYDVQYKPSGATTWTNLRKNTAAATGKLPATEPGDYVVRARTSNTEKDEESGWSPKVKLTVS